MGPPAARVSPAPFMAPGYRQPIIHIPRSGVSVKYLVPEAEKEFHPCKAEG